METKHVYKAINNVQAEMAKIGISKDRKNQQQGYAFRGIDDVYGSIAPLLAKEGLVILPHYTERTCVERTTAKGGVIFYAVVKGTFELVDSEDGSSTTCELYGEAMDSADKATNKAMSAAYKYMCLQTFCIPTEGDNDADATTHTVVSAAKSADKPAAKPAEKAEPTPDEIPVGNLSNKCALDIAAAKTTGELISIYNAYATTEPIADLKAACAAMKKQLESGNSAE